MSSESILCIPDGLIASYNNGETFKETVFSIINNKIKQHFTFECLIEIDDNLLEKKINEVVEIKEIPKGFLWYSFAYQISFAHFCTQTIPLLTDYLQNYSDYPLLVPNHTYTIFQKELLELLGISKKNIILLEANTIYKINNLFTRKRYDSPPLKWSSEHLYIYNKLRMPLYITKNAYPKQLIYLKRDGIRSSSHGNAEVGITRKILNEDKLIEMLTSYGFKIITLGQKSIKEKKDLLNDINILISQLGANCINLLFSNTPKHILLLSNDRPVGENYYVPLNCELNSSSTEYQCWNYQSDTKYSDPKNTTNCAFSVDIDSINKYIKERIMMG